jgi:hypothetical protein
MFVISSTLYPMERLSQGIGASYYENNHALAGARRHTNADERGKSIRVHPRSSAFDNCR